MRWEAGKDICDVNVRLEAHDSYVSKKETRFIFPCVLLLPADVWRITKKIDEPMMDT
jgi:hypothetical protein